MRTGETTEFSRIASGSLTEEIGENPKPLFLIFVISVLGIIASALMTTIFLSGGMGVVVDYLIEQWYIGIAISLLLMFIITILGIKASEGMK